MAFISFQIVCHTLAAAVLLFASTSSRVT